MIVLADFIGSAASRYVIAALAFAATGCVVVTIAFVFSKREKRLERRLAAWRCCAPSVHLQKSRVRRCLQASRPAS